MLQAPHRFKVSEMKKILLASVAAIALTAASVAIQHTIPRASGSFAAFADEHGGSGGKGGQGYRGGRGAAGDSGGSSTDEGWRGGSGVKGGHSESGDSHDEGSGQDSSHSDGSDHGGKSGSADRGGRGGGGTDASGSDDTRQGGRPVWAQEGIPEVELGRLNVARSPTQVIDRAFDEALSTFDPKASAALYSKTAEEFAAIVRENWNSVTIVDSPLQNLGLFRDIRADGTTQLAGVNPASTTDLTAIFLGTASDKAMPISNDTVKALNAIMGLPALSDSDAAAIAAKAETVRQGIQAGHDAGLN